MAECPACGMPVRSGQNECPECGAPLEGVTESFAPIGEPEAAAAAVGASDGPMLVVHKGPEVGERFYIDRPELSLGRDPGSDVFLNDITVSRRHAVVRWAGGRASVEDAGSLNGTYVNGVRVDEAELSDGDTLQIGRFVMRFVAGGAS